MSIAARQVFLKDTERAFGAVLTVDLMSQIMPLLGEALAGFEIEQLIDASDSGTDFLQAFLDAKAIEGRSEKTLERYKYLINRFLEESKTPTMKITVYHLRQFLMTEKKRGIADRTLEGYRSVFSSYFGWLHKEGLIPQNPCANLGAIKCAKLVKEPYSPTDIERLKEACRSLRDKAIVAFLLSTGCRISEVCALDRDDINASAYECTVLGKGNKERIVYLDSVAMMLLQRYLATRKDMNGALFVGQRGERLQPGGVRFMLKQLEARTGVQNVHPHRFRRTLATNLILHGMPIQEVSLILGHDKIDTTMRYIYTDQSNVKHSYQKYA